MLQTIFKECSWCFKHFDPVMAACGTGTTWCLYRCPHCNHLTAEGWAFPKSVVDGKTIKMKSIPNPHLLAGQTVKIHLPAGTGSNSTNIGVGAVPKDEGMKKSVIDIGWGDADIYVDGQKVLHIGQVSDDDTINLFLEPTENGAILDSIISEHHPEHPCTHEVLVHRKKRGASED